MYIRIFTAMLSIRLEFNGTALSASVIWLSANFKEAQCVESQCILMLDEGNLCTN